MVEHMDLAAELRSRRVMTLQDIQEALGGKSAATAHRRLAGIPYRTSYNFNGRYYSFHDETKYDRHGLWSYRQIRFSRDGSLTAASGRLVREAPCGFTQRELQQLLGVRVQNTLTSLVQRGSLNRERIGRSYVYLASDSAWRQQQREQRKQAAEREQEREEVSLAKVIDILLVLIRHPGSNPAAVARRLRQRSPPIDTVQIESVFRRYQLGSKRGLSTS